MTTVCIDGCRCKRRSFRELRELARELGGDADADMIALATGAGVECGTCRPWLERALAEGRDCFELDAGGDAEGERLLTHFGTGRCGEE